MRWFTDLKTMAVGFHFIMINGFSIGEDETAPLISFLDPRSSKAWRTGAIYLLSQQIDFYAKKIREQRSRTP